MTGEQPTMADVLAGHMLGGTTHGYGPYEEFMCLCGADGPLAGFAAHQAAALSAAGFGPVRTDEQRLMLAATLAYDAIEDSALQQARADAWDEGKNAVWTFMTNTDPRRERPTNPYREDT